MRKRFQHFFRARGEADHFLLRAHFPRHRFEQRHCSPAQHAQVLHEPTLAVAVRGFAQATSGSIPFAGESQLPLMLWVMAALSMTLGNVMALIQDNLKRILAYSGIAHAGYMLLGLLTAGAASPGSTSLPGLDALLVYLAAYTLMTLGTFAVICYVHRAETVEDMAGLGRTNPVAAACLAVALLSLIGLPLTAGFAGKFLLFFGLFEASPETGLGPMNRVLVAIAALNAAIGAVVYLRLLAVLYLRSPLNAEAKATGTGPLLAAFLTACATIAIGVYPKPLVEAARQASPALMKASK